MYDISKYEPLLNEIKDKTGVERPFNPDTIKIMIDLENDTFTKNLKLNDWWFIFEKAKKENNYELMLSILQSNNVPYEVFNRTFAQLPFNLDFMAFSSNSFTTSAFNSFYEKHKKDNSLSSIIECDGDVFCDRMIKELCKKPLPELKKMLYTPFQFANEKHIDIIKDYLQKVENNEIELSELALTFIATNDKLPDEIRDKAFELGYMPDVMEDYGSYTKKMCIELYKIYADLLFDIKENEATADRNLERIFDEKDCPESCLIDFIKRTVNEELYTETFKNVLQTTTSEKVLLEAFSHPAKPILPNSDKWVLQNYKYISNDLLKEILNKRKPNDLIDAFMQIIMHQKIPFSTAHIFICKHDISVDAVALISSKSDDDTINKILQHRKNTKYERWFNYLNEIKCFAKSNMILDAYNPFMTFVLDKMQEQHFDYSNDNRYTTQNTNFTMLKIINEFKNKWTMVSDIELKNIKNFFKSFIKKYPEFSDVSRTIMDVALQNNKSFKLAGKYIDIFATDKTSSKLLEYENFPVINFDELYNLDDVNLNNFIKDIKETNDIIIADKIIECIEYEVCSDIFQQSNKPHKIIYKLSELYNVCNEIVEDKIKGEITFGFNGEIVSTQNIVGR